MTNLLQNEPAESLMRQGGQYYRLALKACDARDRAFWVDRLEVAIQASHLQFGDDVWVTKELEGLLAELVAEH